MHVEFAESSLLAGPAPEGGAGLDPCSRFAVSAFISAIDAVLEFVFLHVIVGCWNRDPGQPESDCLICQPIPGFMVL